MMSLMLPGVAVTYNGEEIGMTNTNVSWEDTVDPAGLNCGEEHYMVRGIFYLLSANTVSDFRYRDLSFISFRNYLKLFGLDTIEWMINS